MFDIVSVCLNERASDTPERRREGGREGESVRHIPIKGKRP